MADIFYHQGLYRQEQVYDKLAEKFAWKGKDTLAALINMEEQCFAFKRLGQIDSVIYIIEKVANLYKKYGYPSDAAIALGIIVRDLVEKGEDSKARIYMDRYESKSGFFDEEGNIQEQQNQVLVFRKGRWHQLRPSNRGTMGILLQDGFWNSNTANLQPWRQVRGEL